MTLSASLMAGLLATHVFVPPTPGPIAAAGILGADLGKVVLYGLIVSVPVILVSVLFANSSFMKKKFPRYITDEDAAPVAEVKDIKAPSTFMSYVPIIIPIVFIVAQSFANQYMAEGTLRSILAFIGHPAIALMIGTAIAFTIAPKTVEVRDSWIGRALEKATVILMVTAAAGSFGKVLSLTGVGEYLGGIISTWGLPVLLPFLVSAFILTAQGSATVALLTTSAIIAPMLPALGISPEIAVLAIAAGAVTVVHANGSYFW